MASLARQRLAAALEQDVAEHRWRMEIEFSVAALQLQCRDEWICKACVPLLAKLDTNYDQLIELTEHGTRFTTVKTITRETNP